MDRVVSVVIAAVYVGVAWVAADGEAAGRVAMFTVFPLAFIWFSESIGAYTGGAGRGFVTTASPGWMVAVGGWVLLLLPAVIGLIWYLSPS